MAKLTKKQQLEFDALQMKLDLAEKRIATLEREHADMVAELAPSSEQGKAYQSKLARMEELLSGALAEVGQMIDKLMATRHALENVCSAAHHNQDAIDRAAAAERQTQERILELMKTARDITKGE